MGPVEVVFLTVIGLFGAIGVVRGYQRELGVTTMLLLALFIIEFLTTTAFGERISSTLVSLGLAEAQVETIFLIGACVLLGVVTFISYQGLGLTYPGSGQNAFLSLLIGLINGYLFAGSVWYYLQKAGWPLVDVVTPYSSLYDFLVQLLPPEIFGWQFFILVAVAMLIIRVAK